MAGRLLKIASISMSAFACWKDSKPIFGGRVPPGCQFRSKKQFPGTLTPRYLSRHHADAPRLRMRTSVAGGQGQHEREVRLLSSHKVALAPPADDPGPAEAFLDRACESVGWRHSPNGGWCIHRWPMNGCSCSVRHVTSRWRNAVHSHGPWCRSSCPRPASRDACLRFLNSRPACSAWIGRRM